MALAAAFLCAASPGCTSLFSGKNFFSGPFQAAVRFYQGPLDHLNAVRSGSCPMQPSCSEYCLQAVEKHGAIIGWIMSCDRLMRCGRDEIELSSPVLVDGSPRWPDPVTENDWWWYSPESRPAGHPLKNWHISIDQRRTNGAEQGCVPK